MSDALDISCKLLRDIEVLRDEDERRKAEKEGKVTKSFLRKVFELLDEVGSKEEFIISVGYMVARRKEEKKEKEDRESDAKKFFRNLREFVERKEGSWERIRDELRSVMEYTIKIYTIKADLGEDLCTRR
ncbi:MAG: hypothetical protein ACK401_06340 [Archaeoglobaceae archaeon]